MTKNYVEYHSLLYVNGYAYIHYYHIIIILARQQVFWRTHIYICKRWGERWEDKVCEKERMCYFLFNFFIAKEFICIKKSASTAGLCDRCKFFTRASSVEIARPGRIFLYVYSSNARARSHCNFHLPLPKRSH